MVVNIASAPWGRICAVALLALLLSAALPGRVFAGETLDNEKLIKMLSAGIALDVITNQITSNLNDCHFSASPDALIALQKAGEEGKWPPEDIKVLQKKIQEVAKGDEKRLAALADKALNIFDNADDAEYAAIINELRREDKAIVPYLLARIEQESERKRSGVLDAIGRIGDKSPPVLKAVQVRLYDRAKPVRLQAAKCVATLAGPETCGELIAMLGSQLEKVDGVAMALGFLGDPQAIEPLVKLLKVSSDSDARVCAAFALGELRAKTPAATDALLAAVLDDRDDKLRDAAAAALARVGEKRLPAYIKKACERFPRQGRETIIQHLAHYKDLGAAEWLAELVDSDDPKLKAAASATLQAMTGEKYDTSEEWKGWIEVNRYRPDWIRSEDGAPKASETGK